MQPIAIFLPSLAGGGAERVMLNLAMALTQAGERVELVLASASGPYLAQLPSEVGLVDLGCRRTLASLPALARYLRRARPKALIAALDHANLVAIWARQLAWVPTRVIVTVHCHLSQLMQRSAATKGPLLPQLMRLFFPLADSVVAVSEGVRQDLLATLGLPAHRVATVYNPVVSPALARLSGAPCPHPWLDAGPPVILGIGRLSAQKDFATLIAAFAALLGAEDARLIILGEGEQRAELEALIARLKLQARVALPGFVANPYAYLSRARLFVLSSRWEGLPTVLIEALALGVPVVATDCQSGPREILQGGAWGELVPVGQPELLAQAMRRALTAPRRVEPAQVASYTFEAAAQRYLELIA